MSRFCILTNTKEFKNTQSKFNIGKFSLEKILYDYYNNVANSDDVFPSDEYIQQKLNPTVITNNKKILEFVKQNGYDSPIITNDTNKFKQELDKVKKFFTDDQFVTYTDTDGNSVMKVADFIYDENSQLEFVNQNEIEEIKRKAIANGTFMKAPNGQPTKLNERQWLQVRTKAFIDWFGDWINDPENASKIIDNKGEDATFEPLVVYHGTRSDFNAFSKDFLGKLTGASSAKKAFFAASSSANSAVYANFQDEYSIWQSYAAANEGDVRSLGIEKEPEEPSLSEIYPTFEDKIHYLERRYPEIIKKARENVGTTNRPTFSPEGELVSEIEEQHPDDVLNYIFQNAKNESKYFQSALKDLFGLTTLDDIQQSLRGQLNDNVRQFYDSRLKPVFLNIRDPKIDNDNNQGYRNETYSNRIDAALSEDKDGGIILNTADPLPTNVYYFFDPNQIKSATDNMGTFSRTDSNIYNEDISSENPNSQGKVDTRLQELFARNRLSVSNNKKVTVKDLLSIVENSKYSSIVSLLNTLDKIKELDDIKVELVNGSSEKFNRKRAYYNASERTIYINVNAQYENGDSSSVLLHEVLHPLTIDRIQQNAKLRKEILSIIDEYQEVYFDTRYVEMSKRILAYIGTSFQFWIDYKILPF